MINQGKGFTFIELTVVVMLIGLFISMAVPRFRTALLTDELKGSVRKMTALINSLRNEAALERRSFYLHLDLDSNKFWVESDETEDAARAREEAFALPGEVRILDIWAMGLGKKVMGETSVHFSSKGYVRKTVVHLGTDEERSFTLVLEPFLPKVRIMEGYIDFEEV